MEKSGLKNKIFFYSEERSMFQRILPLEERLWNCIMILRLLATQADGRLLNLSPEITGGLECLDLLQLIAEAVIDAIEPRPFQASLLANLHPLKFPRISGRLLL